MKKIIVVGTGGLAREFSSYFSEHVELIEIVGFFSTNHSEHGNFSLPGILLKGDINPDRVGTNLAVVAIGAPKIKKEIIEKMTKLGFDFPTFIHPSAVVSGRANISKGVVISPNCTVSPNVSILPFTYLNFNVGVGHDAIISSFVQINPGVQVGGFSSIGEESLIGSGSTIIQGVNVGCKVTIASGSVVFSCVADGATMMGNPAKRMRSFENESC